MNRVNRLLPIGLLLISCLLMSSSSWASSREEAREAFKRGRAHFVAGHYGEATAALKLAYKLSPHPALLRYLGQSYDKWNKPKTAIHYYNRYLKGAPKAADRRKILRRIAYLKRKTQPKAARVHQKVKKQAADKEEVLTPPAVDLRPTGEDNEMPDVFGAQRHHTQGAETESEQTNWLKVGAWSSVALTGASVVMGSVFLMMANSEASDLEDAVKSTNPDGKTPTVSYNETHFDMQQAYQRNNTIATVSFIAGGVFAATAVTLFLLESKKGNDSNVAIIPAAGPQQLGVSATLRF